MPGSGFINEYYMPSPCNLRKVLLPTFDSLVNVLYTSLYSFCKLALHNLTMLLQDLVMGNGVQRCIKFLNKCRKASAI